MRRLAPLAAALGLLAVGCASPPPPPRPGARPPPVAPAPATRPSRTEPAPAPAPRLPARPVPATETRRGGTAVPATESSAVPGPAAEPVVPATALPPPSPESSPGEQALRQGEAAEQAGALETALGAYRRAAQLQQSGAAARADAVRRKLVIRHSAAARGALARQDLDGSIRQWERVLELDPGNDTARLERQRAIALREKVRALR